MDKDSQRQLYNQAWAHIDQEDFATAESCLRQLLSELVTDDSLRVWEVAGLLASVLNSLSRPAEATEMYRQKLAAARRLGENHSSIDVSRFFLANQYLNFGDPRDALATAQPVPDGIGHVECLLHSIVAQALWKLDRQAEARTAAGRAVAASPTDERIADMHRDLQHIIDAR